MRGLPMICLLIFLVYTAQSMYTPLIPLYLAEGGRTAADVGFVIFANVILSSVLSIPFGLFSDRIGRKKVTTLGAAIASLGSLAFLYSDNFYFILLAYSVMGVGHGAYGSGTTAYPADIGVGKGLARSIAWAQMFRQLAFITGPVAGSFLKVGQGYTAAFASAASLMSAGTLVGLWLLPPVQAGRRLLQEKVEKTTKPTGTLWLIPLILLMTLTMAFSVGTFTAFIPLYASEKGMPIYVIGFIFAAQALSSASVRLMVGEAIRRRRGEWGIFTASGLVASGVMASLGQFTAPEPIVGLAFVLGLTHGSGIFLSNFILAKVAPEARRGLVISFMNTVFYAGMGLGPAVMGQVIEAYGFDWAFKASAAVTASGAVVFMAAAGRRGKARPMQL